jgi:ATP-dependent Clp protease ATP-binding subunit ClpX
VVLEGLENESNFLQFISPADLRSYGLIPEIIGRIPVLAHLNPLDKATLRSILTEPKNALIKQYTKLFEIEGIKLTIEDEVIDMIVDKAFEFKLGARGLRSICEAIMLDYMYEIPSQRAVSELRISSKMAAQKMEKIKMKSMKAA